MKMLLTGTQIYGRSTGSAGRAVADQYPAVHDQVSSAFSARHGDSVFLRQRRISIQGTDQEEPSRHTLP